MAKNMEELKLHNVICSAFVEKDGRFLMVLCPRFRVWRVPGGRLEFGERLEDTLIREMKEELGIEIESPKFIGWGQDNQYHFIRKVETSRLLMFFHVKTDKEITIDPGEADDHKWVTLEEMRKEQKKEGGLTDFFERNPDLNL